MVPPDELDPAVEQAPRTPEKATPPSAAPVIFSISRLETTPSNRPPASPAPLGAAGSSVSDVLTLLSSYCGPGSHSPGTPRHNRLCTEESRRGIMVAAFRSFGQQ